MHFFFIYMQTLTESVGKTMEDIEVLLMCLKVEPEKECFQQVSK